MVVLAILGLTLVLAMPALDRLLPGLELRTEARDLASALREARAHAIGQNEVVTVVIDQERAFLKSAGKPAAPLSAQVKISSVTETSQATAGGEIRFFPDGTSTGGVLTLALGDRREHVVVDWLTGAVSVSE